MNTTVYLSGILLQAIAAVIALLQVRQAPRKLPWLLIALSSLLIVGRRASTLDQVMKTSRELAPGEILTLIISGLFFFGVIFMTRMFRDVWEHQVLLQRSEAALRLKNLVFDTSIAANCITDLEGVITETNNAFLRLWGCRSKDEVVGKPMQYFLSDPNEVEALITTIDRTGQWEGDLTTRRIDGKTFIVHTVASAVRDATNQVIGYQSASVDITERTQAEEALKGSEEKYRALHESMMDGFVSVDMTGRIKEFNEPYRQMLGYSREELPCLTYMDLTPERWHAFEQDIVVSQILEKGYSEVYEKEYRRKDGTVFPVELRTFLVKEGRDREQQMWAIVRDISRRKWMEEELRKSEERYRAIFENATEGIFQTTPEGRYFSVNPAFVRMFGFSSAQEMIETATDIGNKLHVNLDDRLSVIEMLRESEKVEGFETEAYRKDGSKFWISINVHTVKDFTGNILFLEGTTVDITERKRAEEEHLEYEQHLHRTKKAESLNRMAGAIAHHFNNKLMAVIGNLELALDDLSPEDPGAAMLRGALQAATQAAEVSNLMLAYLGQITAEFALIDLTEVCREVIARATSSLYHRISLDTEIPPDRLTIRASQVKVGQVLSNLITNAREAIGDNQGSIRVSVRVVSAKEMTSLQLFPVDWKPEADLYVSIEVSDTGCGIPADQLDSIFDPFFTTKFTGRGLGLAMVQGTLRQDHGAVAVESAPGLGSTFRVFWPLEAQEATPAPKAEPAVSWALGPLGLVLVVDDDPQVLSMAQTMLRRLGGDVLAARDGFEAVEIFRKRKNEIHLVLLDLTMPGMDGWETLATLRALRQDIPVILASGYDESQVMGSDHPELPQAFLHKPYRKQDLEAAIGTALGTPKK